MPIMWRYLLTHFIKVFCFCVLAFIAVLLTLRLEAIAQFAGMGAPIRYVILFILYQIPYILPIAIPISCLISSIILVQRLSTSHELTALRSCGFSLKDILAPILTLSCFLCVLNFFIISEIATKSHLTTSLLKSELRAINPLILLNNKPLRRLKGIYFNAMGSTRSGEYAHDVILAMPNQHQNRINVMIAKKLHSSLKQFEAQDITLMSSFNSKEQNEFDNFLIDNIQKASTSVSDFSQILQKNVWKVSNDYLTMPMLLVRTKEQIKFLNEARLVNQPSQQIKYHKHLLYQCLSEISRRLSVAFAPFTFTLIGAIFGISISRRRQSRGIFIVLTLATLYLVAFFTAKGLEKYFITATLLYSIPHLLMTISSLIMLKRISRGIE